MSFEDLLKQMQPLVPREDGCYDIGTHGDGVEEREEKEEQQEAEGPPAGGADVEIDAEVSFVCVLGFEPKSIADRLRW
jgi:hypothetical protein